jgi:hypothetical protein
MDLGEVPHTVNHLLKRHIVTELGLCARVVLSCCSSAALAAEAAVPAPGAVLMLQTGAVKREAKIQTAICDLEWASDTSAG